MKKLLHIVIILIVFLVNINVVFAQPPVIDADACILIDSGSGQVLYENNADRTHEFPASTTKIMTAILAIEMGDPNQVMIASQAAVDDIGKDGSNIGIMPGEEITLNYLLQALLISSANETANIIAENLSPTRQEFVDLMNQKAQELGCTGTHFVNPCGAHDPNHYTTASDLAKIARYAMTLPEFRKIVHMKNFQMLPTNKHESWPVLATTNKLMQSDKSENYEIIGVKTGYTVPAGHNLVTSAVNADGMELLAVVMGVRNEGAKDNVKKYSKELLDYGFDNFTPVTLQEDNKVYRSIPVADAEDASPLDVVTKGEVKYVLPKDTSLQNVTVIPSLKESVSAPVNQGDLLGSIDFQRNGVSIGKVDLVASRSVKSKPQVEIVNKAKNLLDNDIFRRVLLSVLILLISFILLRTILRRISRSRKSNSGKF